MGQNSGVYKIRNLLTEELYVGSSRDIPNRWRQHRYRSKVYDEIKHHPSCLYRAIQKYGLDKFAFELIEECGIDDLLIREKYYIDLMKPQYNMSRHAVGAPWTPERKQTYALRRKAEVAAGINVPPKGNAGNKEFRHTEESKQLMRQKAAEAHERIMAERGSYHTPEGIASRRAKMDDWLTPERRERFREETKEALKLAKRNQKAYADAFAQQHLPMIQSMLTDGFNFLQIAEKMNADGHRTRQDAVWTDQTVRQILKRVGRKSPVSRLERAERERKQRADDFARSLYAIIHPMRQAGLDLSEIAARLNAEGHRTRRGSEWTYQLVGNVIRRMEAYVPKSRGIGSELLLGGLTSSTKPVYGATRVIGWDRI